MKIYEIEPGQIIKVLKNPLLSYRDENCSSSSWDDEYEINTEDKFVVVDAWHIEDTDLHTVKALHNGYIRYIPFWEDEDFDLALVND